MKKLFILISVLSLGLASNAQPVCPAGNLVQNAKWSFNFSQCMKDSLYMTYLDTSKIMYVDANGVVTTISYQALLDSLNISTPTPGGSQWSIQINDSGVFSGSNNVKSDEDFGVFYITDTGGDTLFSVNTQTREVRSRGTFSVNLPDSSGVIVDGNGNLVADSVRWAWKGDGWYLLNRYAAPSSSGALIITGSAPISTRILHTVISNPNNSAPTYNFFRARGTIMAPSSVTTGSVLGAIQFAGYTGTTFSGLAAIEGIAGGSFASSITPTYFRITTTDHNAGSYSLFFTQKGGISIKGQFFDTIADLTVNGSLTGSQDYNAIRILQTWNTTGNPTGIFANFTNTASGASTNIIDLRVSNVSRFTVSKGGALTGLATIQTSSVGIFGTGGTVVGDGANILYQNSAANGAIRVTAANNWSFSSVNFLSLGGATSAFPAFKRSATELQVRLADDSGYAPLQAGNTTVNSVLTLTPVSATDASALTPAFGMLVVVNSTNGTFTTTGLWFYNGAAWVLIS